jgi:osmotically-inducible protein OsmY
MVSPMTSATDQVVQALQDDPRMKGAAIDVSSERGIVTLTGTVSSEAVRQMAEKIARDQPGVVTVINEIKVVH